MPLLLGTGVARSRVYCLLKIGRAAGRSTEGEIERRSEMSDQAGKSGTSPDGASALKGEELKKLFGQLDFGWTMPNEHHLEKEYHFKDFREALGFVNRLGE